MKLRLKNDKDVAMAYLYLTDARPNVVKTTENGPVNIDWNERDEPVGIEFFCRVTIEES